MNPPQDGRTRARQAGSAKRLTPQYGLPRPGHQSSLRPAFESLRVHKVRATLGTLGVMIAAAAVISLLTLGSGSRQEARDLAPG